MLKIKVSAKKVLVLVGVICLFLQYLLWLAPESALAIYTFDIGQGDSLLIKTQDNKYILVDGGFDEKALAQLQQVIPFWQRDLDLVILTHPDQDHVGGLPLVLDYYEVKNVIYTPVEHENGAYYQLQDIVQGRQIPHHKLRDQADFQIGCCTYFDVLWPQQETELEKFQKDVNDTSFAFVLMVGEFSMFFGGDLGAKYEELIFAENKYDLNVLKVGHHGSTSSTSPRVLELTNPEYAVIPVGKDNKFNHPTGEVLQNLQDSGVRIFRTDRDGRVEIVLD